LLRNVLAEPASVETVAQIAHSAVPVLLIAGSEDSEAVASCNELAERIPHARVHIVDGAGHVVNLVNPSAFNAALFTFLDAIDAAPEGSTDARKQA
jgi:pimeloyl-ACP methyl ester carboxylesterase